MQYINIHISFHFRFKREKRTKLKKQEHKLKVNKSIKTIQDLCIKMPEVFFFFRNAEYLEPQYPGRKFKMNLLNSTRQNKSLFNKFKEETWTP